MTIRLSHCLLRSVNGLISKEFWPPSAVTPAEFTLLQAPFTTSQRTRPYRGCMMMINHMALAAFLALATLPGVAYASTPTSGTVEQQVTLYELVLRDGSRMYGVIDREDPAEVVFKTQAGAIVTAKRSEIATLTKVTGTMHGANSCRPTRTPPGCFLLPPGGHWHVARRTLASTNSSCLSSRSV